MSTFSQGATDAVARVRANPLETALLAFACVSILFAIEKTVVIASRGAQRQDLTFAAAADELGRSLSTGATERIGRLDHAFIVVGGDSIPVDTIAAAADSTIEPAFARGGFVRDQISLYNDFAIRRAFLSSRDGSGVTRPADGPSLFRTVVGDDRARRLADRPNPYAMVIRSPYAEGSWREVRTTDWRSSPALLGYDGEVALPADRPDGFFQSRLNGHDCTVSSKTPHFFLYCQSALGAISDRFYDFRFDVRARPSGPRFESAGPYRQRSIWVNGRAQMFGDKPVAGGDVFDVQSLGPFVLSSAEWGTLSSEQWINGRRSFANTRLGTLSFFAGAGRSTASDAALATPLVLGFDAGLQTDLDRASAKFLRAHRGLLSRLVAVVLDVRTGEIRAIAEPARTSDDEPLVSFEPVLVGSAVKPIIASAILAKHPQLANLRVSYAGDSVRTVNGIELTKPFNNEANGCSGEIDFDAFLRCSSNQYASELMIRSLAQDGFAWHGTGQAIVPRAALERSAIASGLAEVFDVDAYANRTRGRSPLYWNVADAVTPNVPAVTSDSRLMPFESRPWLLFPDSPGTPVDLVARYAFGGWEDRWTLLGLAQAYARISTDRDVQAVFLHRPVTNTSKTISSFPAASPAARAAFARVRRALRQVGTEGTAAGITPRLLAATSTDMTVLSKTGTLNEEGAGGRLKALAMAIGSRATPAEDAPLACGLVVVTYFEFAPASRAAQHQTLPPVHRDFAQGPLADVLAHNWSRMSGCTPTAKPQLPAPPPTKRAQ